MRACLAAVLGSGSLFGVACSDVTVVAAATDAGERDGGSPVREGQAGGSVQSDGPFEGAPTDTSSSGETESGASIRQLFNGLDLDGWDTYLGPPYGSQQPIGANLDPGGVFSVTMIDDAPAIRISGETWGALTTREEFSDYHLHAEFKWGTHAVWPPLTVRDSGLMYHSVGPFGAVTSGGGALAAPPLSGYFMTSLELQIAQGDVGSCYSLGPLTIDNGAFTQAASTQNEKPLGAWNLLDVFVVGNESVHLVNGQKVVHVTNATLIAEDGGRAPLTRGKIQLQSESMEIYFRAVALIPIDRIPDELL